MGSIFFLYYQGVFFIFNGDQYFIETRERTFGLKSDRRKKMELEMIRKEKIQGLFIRSRVRWAEERRKAHKVLL